MYYTTGKFNIPELITIMTICSMSFISWTFPKFSWKKNQEITFSYDEVSFKLPQLKFKISKKCTSMTNIPKVCGGYFLTNCIIQKKNALIRIILASCPQHLHFTHTAHNPQTCWKCYLNNFSRFFPPTHIMSKQKLIKNIFQYLKFC